MKPGWAIGSAPPLDAQTLRVIGRSASEIFKEGRQEEAVQLIEKTLGQVYAPNLLLLKCELLTRMHARDRATGCLDEFAHAEPVLDGKQQSKVAELRGRLARARTEQSAALPEPGTLLARPENAPAAIPTWRRGWFWGVMAATGAAALGVGLSLGLTPRPYETVVWTR